MNPEDVRCPKCKAAPGEPCQSIKRGGRIGTFPYSFHKKRKVAAILVPLVLSPKAVPVRPARGLRVGAVDSAVRGLPSRVRRGSA